MTERDFRKDIKSKRLDGEDIIIKDVICEVGDDGEIYIETDDIIHAQIKQYEEKIDKLREERDEKDKVIERLLKENNIIREKWHSHQSLTFTANNEIKSLKEEIKNLNHLTEELSKSQDENVKDLEDENGHLREDVDHWVMMYQGSEKVIEGLLKENEILKNRWKRMKSFLVACSDPTRIEVSDIEDIEKAIPLPGEKKKENKGE